MNARVWAENRSHPITDNTQAEREDLQIALQQYIKYPCATTKKVIGEYPQGR